MRTPGTLALTLALSVALLASCKKADREWSPSDHDHAENPGAQPPQQPPRPTAPPTAQAAGPASPDAVWTSTCVPCHGPNGKGEGPMGAALRVPDLTRSKMADADVAAIIKNGRGKMPAGNYPQPVVDGLVKKVLSLR